MAQTKQRAAPKRASSSRKSQTRSRSASAKPKSSRGKSGASNTGNATKATTKIRAMNGSKPAAVASKAKVPLLAGGAALAGAAGGLVMGARHGRHGGRLTRAMQRRPKVKVDSHDIAKVAKEVGKAGAQVGHLASELQLARETANGGKRRSPVEVVLDGLTHRRSHS